MKIRILSQENGRAFIEWNDNGLHRGTLPTELVTNEDLDDACLSLAIPFGIDWEAGLVEKLKPVTPEKMADYMRREGLWTKEDVYRNPGKVQSALMSAYGIDLQQILQIASQRR